MTPPLSVGYQPKQLQRAALGKYPSSAPCVAAGHVQRDGRPKERLRREAPRSTRDKTSTIQTAATPFTRERQRTIITVGSLRAANG